MEPQENHESEHVKLDENVPAVAQEQMVSAQPDGGFIAWLQVLAAHLVVVNTWGYMTSFGIFQGFYVEKLNESPSNISWIGSIQTFFLFFLAMFSGRGTDAGYAKPLLIAGLSLQLISVFTTSVCKTYWQLILSQGFCFGIGSGLAFMPAYATVSTYFVKHRVLAMCLVSCGTSTGGLIFPAIARTLMPSTGFGWTVRVMGFVMVFDAIVAVLVIRPWVPPRRDGQLLDLKAFLEPTYALYTTGAFLAFWSNFIVYYYLRPYAESHLGISSDTSFNLLLVLNGIGYPGRIIPALTAVKAGPVNAVLPYLVIAGILMGCWMAIHSVNAMWAFAVIFGFSSAAMMGLVPAALPSLSSHPNKNGIRIGMVLSVVSLAAVSGTPIGGHLITLWNGEYTGTQIFGCVTFLASAAFVLAARITKCGLRWEKV